jgi:hypothetical protein
MEIGVISRHMPAVILREAKRSRRTCPGQGLRRLEKVAAVVAGWILRLRAG